VPPGSPGERQLSLFAPAARGGVGAALLGDEIAAVAARIPPDIRLGTSSWSFPGWAGLVYDRPASPAMLARHGLAAYARHPLLRSVGIDRTYYAPVDAATFAAWGAVVPADFRFLVKAHELVTAARVPSHGRYGPAAGQPNDRFLLASYAADAVVGPSLEGLGDRLGVVLFQFPPQALGEPARFPERLAAFLTALPRGPAYAVELRNAELLGPAYARALATAGACHCINVHPSMPPPAVQMRLAPAEDAPALVVRWMLARHLGYQEARARYAPFDRLAEPDPTTRGAIGTLCLDARARGRPAFVIVNNKAEGSSPLSVVRLAEWLATHAA
jgi:uncharacterized protein YecE (DUF72 family)